MEVAIIMDTVLSLVFLGDFLYRLFTAESKMTYFLRQFGWADLWRACLFHRRNYCASFVFPRRSLDSPLWGKSLIHEFVSDRGGDSVLSLLFLMFLVLEFGAIVMLRAERIRRTPISRPPATSLRYVYVTITTVGLWRPLSCRQSDGCRHRGDDDGGRPLRHAHRLASPTPSSLPKKRSQRPQRRDCRNIPTTLPGFSRKCKRRARSWRR